MAVGLALSANPGTVREARKTWTSFWDGFPCQSIQTALAPAHGDPGPSVEVRGRAACSNQDVPSRPRATPAVRNNDTSGTWSRGEISGLVKWWEPKRPVNLNSQKQPQAKSGVRFVRPAPPVRLYLTSASLRPHRRLADDVLTRAPLIQVRQPLRLAFFLARMPFAGA